MTAKGFDSTRRFGKRRLDTLGATGHTIACIYLGGERAATNQSLLYPRRLTKAGFGLIPIWVGYQQADLTGQNLEAVDQKGRESAIAANKAYEKLKGKVPDGTLLNLTLDWEGEMTTEGKAYCHGFLSTINPAFLPMLYRTDLGPGVGEWPVWLAHPGITEAEAMSYLGRAEYGMVIGVQYEWLPDIDYSIFHDVIKPPGPPVKPDRKPRHLPPHVSVAYHVIRPWLRRYDKHGSRPLNPYALKRTEGLIEEATAATKVGRHG